MFIITISFHMLHTMFTSYDVLQLNTNVYAITLTGPSTDLEKENSFRQTLTPVCALTSITPLQKCRAIDYGLTSGMMNRRIGLRACALRLSVLVFTMNIKLGTG